VFEAKLVEYKVTKVENIWDEKCVDVFDCHPVCEFNTILVSAKKWQWLI